MRSLIYYILIIAFFAIAVIFSERAGDDTQWAVIFIFLFVLTIWLLVSTLVCLYWLYSPPDFFWVKHRRISTAFYVSAFLVCGVIVGMGVSVGEGVWLGSCVTVGVVVNSVIEALVGSRVLVIVGIGETVDVSKTTTGRVTAGSGVVVTMGATEGDKKPETQAID